MNDPRISEGKKLLRNTALREALLAIFRNEKRPLTIPELTEMLAKKAFFPNKTSLYRQIETLSKSGVLQRVTLVTDIAHFEYVDYHHHHFVCRECNETACVNDEELERSIADVEEKLRQQGITIEDHQFSFTGVCKKCH